jgi:hypothetical protein
MRRPSHWILLSTALAALGYAVFVRPDAAPKEPAKGPVVVRRAGAQDEPHRAAVLQGRVLDRLGWPVDGAVARLVDGASEAIADAAGEFHLAAPAFRGHRVRISAPGRQPTLCWLRPKDPIVVVLEDALPWGTPPAETSVEVADDLVGDLVGEGFTVDGGGTPIPFASVTVIETGVRETADSTGRYRIALPEGPATLLAWDVSGRVARTDPIPSARKHGLVPLPELVLDDGLALRGYVQDAIGQPCAAAALTLRGEGTSRQILTDASGGFAFDGLLEGTYVLEALPHRGSLGLRRQLTVGPETIDLDLALIAGRSLDVQVMANARPAPGVWVLAEEGDLRRVHAKTDADGRAKLSGVGPGPFAFEVRESDDLERYEILSYDEELSLLTVG